MLNKEFLGHLRATHRALWQQDALYRVAVLAFPVLLIITLIHAMPTGGNAAAPVGPPVPTSRATSHKATPNAAATTSPHPLRIKPGAALPANSSISSGSNGYQSPFNQ